MAFGPAFLAAESGRPLLVKELQELVIAWLAEAVLGGRVHGAKAFALSLDEHAEASGDFVVVGEEEFARGTDDPLLGEFKAHRCIPPGVEAGRGPAVPWRIPSGVDRV